MTQSKALGSVFKLNSIINVKDPAYGARGDGTTDDTAAIQSAITAAQAIGAAVYLPFGSYLVSSTLTFSKGIRFFGDGWISIILVKSTVGATTDILKVSPSVTSDAGQTGYVFENFRVSPQSGTPGRHAIAIDITTRAVYESMFRKLRLDALGGRGFVTLPNATPLVDGFFTSTIENCSIYNGIYLDKAGDSIRVLRNTLPGANAAVYADLVFVSAANTPHGLDIIGNNITTSGGCVHIKNAYGGRIAFNIFESSAGNANNALVDIDGTNGTTKPDGVNVSENFFSTPSGVDAVRVNFARYTLIRGNLIAEPGGGAFNYKVTSNAVDTQILDNATSADSVLSTQLSDAGTRTTWRRGGISGRQELNQDIQFMQQGANVRAVDTAGTTIRVVRFENSDNTIKIGTLDSAASNGDVLFFVQGVQRGKFDSSGNFQANGSNAQRTTIKTAMALLSNVSGASVTSSSLIPAGAFVVGVSTRIVTSLGGGGGTTGYTVGDGTTANRFGTSAAITAGTTTTNSGASATFTGTFPAANNVVITAVGGNFNGTGDIRVSVHYIDITAPTS